ASAFDLCPPCLLELGQLLLGRCTYPALLPAAIESGGHERSRSNDAGQFLLQLLDLFLDGGGLSESCGERSDIFMAAVKKESDHASSRPVKRRVTDSTLRFGNHLMFTEASGPPAHRPVF